LRSADTQLGADVLARARVGRRRDRQPRDIREDLRQPPQHPVLGAEVVSPLADAVRLVDGDHGQGHAGQTLQHGGLHEPLRGEVEQVELAAVDPRPGLRPRVRIGHGIQPRRGDPGLGQRRHLVGHQRDQRRDDQANPRPHQRGDLVAEALAAAGRQHRHGAAARQHLGDHVALKPPELGMPERAPQQGSRPIHRLQRPFGDQGVHAAGYGASRGRAPAGVHLPFRDKAAGLVRGRAAGAD
jgi:hypothetical protein